MRLTAFILFILSCGQRTSASASLSEWRFTMENTASDVEPFGPALAWTGFTATSNLFSDAVATWQAIFSSSSLDPQVIVDLDAINDLLSVNYADISALLEIPGFNYAQWNDTMKTINQTTSGMSQAMKMKSNLPGSPCNSDHQCWVNAMDIHTTRIIVNAEAWTSKLYAAVSVHDWQLNLHRVGYWSISDNFQYYSNEWSDWSRQLDQYNKWFGYLVNKIQQTQLLFLWARSWVDREHPDVTIWREAEALVQTLNSAISIMIKTHYDATAWSRTASSFYDMTILPENRVHKHFRWTPHQELQNECWKFDDNSIRMKLVTCPDYKEPEVDVYTVPVSGSTGKFVFELKNVSPSQGHIYCGNEPSDYDHVNMWFSDKTLGGSTTYEWSCISKMSWAVQLNFWPQMSTSDPCYFGIWDKVHVEADKNLLSENKPTWDFNIIPGNAGPTYQSCRTESLYECARGWENNYHEEWSDKEKCLAGGRGWVWSGQDPSKAPGCMAHCSCCRPLEFKGGVVPEFEAPEQKTNNAIYDCYEYTDFDYSKNLLSERDMCETAGFGLVYTGGDEKLAPGCGSCSSHCCQRREYPVDQTRFGTRFQCHHWTAEENVQLELGTPSSWVCQAGGLGRVYTAGSDRLAPGCGGCACCAPEEPPEGPFECHRWSKDEETLINQMSVGHGTDEAEQAVCLSAGFGYVYRGNGNFPTPFGCASECHCCRPTTPPAERYVAYQYTETDKNQGLAEMEMCLTSGAGFVYANRDDGYNLYGNDAVAPGCGRFNCCQPEPKVPALFECHHYSDEEMNRIQQGEDEVLVCRQLAKGIYTGGDASLAPGCGRCYCCTPTSL